MPVNSENATNASKTNNAEEVTASNNSFSTERIGGRNITNLENLIEQISTLNQLFKQPSHDNSVKTLQRSVLVLIALTCDSH